MASPVKGVEGIHLAGTGGKKRKPKANTWWVSFGSPVSIGAGDDVGSAWPGCVLLQPQTTFYDGYPTVAGTPPTNQRLKFALGTVYCDQEPDPSQFGNIIYTYTFQVTIENPGFWGVTYTLWSSLS
jgi:hypothetical protein